MDLPAPPRIFFVGSPLLDDAGSVAQTCHRTRTEGLTGRLDDAQARAVGQLQEREVGDRVPGPRAAGWFLAKTTAVDAIEATMQSVSVVPAWCPVSASHQPLEAPPPPKLLDGGDSGLDPTHQVPLAEAGRSTAT